MLSNTQQKKSAWVADGSKYVKKQGNKSHWKDT